MTVSEKIKQAGQKLSQIRNNKKRALLVSAIASALVIGGTGAAYADHKDHDRKDDKHDISSVIYTGPIETSTVADVLADTSWFSDKEHILEGHVVKQLSDRTFLFTDGAGELVIELERRSRLKFSDKDRVRIQGEYETDFGSDAKFEVEHLTVL